MIQKTTLLVSFLIVVHFPALSFSQRGSPRSPAPPTRPPSSVACSECPCKFASARRELKARLYCPESDTLRRKATCNTCPKQTQPGTVSNGKNCSDVVSIQGFVQVFLPERNEWVFVSSTGWDKGDMDVLCGQLGYPDSFEAPTVSKLLGCNPFRNRTGMRPCGPDGFLDDIRRVTGRNMKCTGVQNYLGKCNNCGWSLCVDPCDQAATAACGYAKKNNGCPDGPKLSLRLRSGPTKSRGRAEVFYRGEWGSICNDGRFGVAEGNVLCKSLGWGTVKYVLPTSHTGWGFDRAWLQHISCRGYETSLDQCRLSPWGVTSYACRTHSEDLGIECNAPSTEDCQTPIRLVTDSSSNGYYPDNYLEVEVKGKKGLACNEMFHQTELTVVCRDLSNEFPLGFRGGKANFYQSKTRFVGRISCDSVETSLRDCNMTFLEVGSCPNGEVIIDCSIKAPDLVPDLPMLLQSFRFAPYLDRRGSYELQCEVEEKCVSQKAIDAFYNNDYSTYYFLRFTVMSNNWGTRDFLPFAAPSTWQYHACHQHYHSFDVFALYELTYLNGTLAAEGHKASFCLEDSLCLLGTRKYSCTIQQGISSGCGDRYSFQVACNWIDVTEVPPGDYILKVTLNPSNHVFESDYENNQALCKLTISKDTYLKVDKCIIRGYGDL